MAKFVPGSKIEKMAYSGATSEHLYHYSDIVLKQHPNSIIVCGGTNDIFGRNSTGKDEMNIVENLIKIGTKCKESGVKNVFLSSLFPIRNTIANNKVKAVNILLRLHCEEYGFTFISNDFITINDLKTNDPVHLSWDGRRKVVDNYITVLNEL